MTKKPSLLIIGGGIVGVTIARQAALSGRFSTIIIAEKEASLGMHASTKNSGVIHAGFYYDPQSERARFCAEGNALMRAYCLENSLPLRKCGKVVVAQSQEEEDILLELKRRGDLNGCELSLLPKSRLGEYEPLASTFENFLWSPNTWSTSPHQVMTKLLSELKQLSVKIKTGLRFDGAVNRVARFRNGDSIAYDVLVNAAGGYALDVSRKLGLSSSYSLLPFKGLYLRTRAADRRFSAHIYPVPNIEQPFLGIHTTLTCDGFLKLGPTAVPALSPENYSTFEGLDLLKIPSLLLLEASLFIKDSFGFRGLAIRELQYLIKENIVREAQSLTSCRLSSADFDWYSPGIRAQLYDHVTQKLVTDFLLLREGEHFHVLNSISPAWTCSFRAAQEVVARLEKFLA